MNNNSKEPLQQIEGKIDIIVALLLRLLPKTGDNLSLKDQIRLLDNLCVRPIEISKIIGRPQNYVSKELVAIRKQK